MINWDEFQEEIKDAPYQQLRRMKQVGTVMVEHCVNKELARREKMREQEPQVDEGEQND